MGLTDDPIYKNMTEGEDSEIIVGTVELGPIGGPRKTFPAFIVDYSKNGLGMDRMVGQVFNDLKKVDLSVNEGEYTLSVGRPTTILLVAEGEMASHTAPEFWTKYTPRPVEDAAFQVEYEKARIWLLMILTNEMFRQFAIDPTGAVLHKVITPMTDQIRKNFKMDESR